LFLGFDPLMENAGTGGALFRNLYRDFIKESYDLLGIEQIAEVHHEFAQIALLWTSLAELFGQIAETASFDDVQQASEIFRTLATKEKNAMEILLSLR